MQPTTRMVEVESRARELMSQWGIGHWHFQFNRRRRHHGVCRHPVEQGKPGIIELSIHYLDVSDDEMTDTILHEIAHALVGPEQGHGPEWVEICKLVGARPQACSQAVAIKNRYGARCPGCGEGFGRINRPRTGRLYYCPDCGQERGKLSFSLLEV